MNRRHFFSLVALWLISWGSIYGQTLKTDPPSGRYCSGGPGVEIYIENAQVGVMYYLKKRPSGTTVGQKVGVAGDTYFTGNYTAGTYYVTPSPPSNDVIVIANPTPGKPKFIMVPGNGKYCTNVTSPGVTLRVDSSQAGVTYKLYKVGTTDTTEWTSGANNQPHIFGTTYLAGQYQVKAVLGNATTGFCSKLSDTQTVVACDPPMANFTYPSGTANICSDNAITFTDASTPAGSITAWLWNFGDPASGIDNTATTNPASHIFEGALLGSSIFDFDVTLTVTDNNGCVDDITISGIPVKQKPDATLCEVSAPCPEVTKTFSYCTASNTSPNGNFTFINGSSSQSFNTSYQITWGPCTTAPSVNGPTFPDQLVNYTCVGTKDITMTVEGNNGCSSTKHFSAYVGSTPKGGILNPGNTYGVNEFCLEFPLDPETYDNTLGTSFELDFGDGNIIPYPTLSSLPPQGSKIPHCYTTCSDQQTVRCNANNPSEPLKYAYRVVFTATNACQASPTQVCPVIVTCPTFGGFGIGGGVIGGGVGWFFGDPNPDHLFGCKTVTFNNSTTPGFYIFPSGTSASTELKYKWDFGDPVTGPLNTSADPTPTHEFSVQGQTYTITLITWTGPTPEPNLTADTVIKEIYIQVAPTANYNVTLDPPGGICLPITAIIENTSDEGGLGVPLYAWRVLKSDLTPAPSGSYAFVTPDHPNDPHYPEPYIQFNTQGTYILEMSLTNACGTSVKLSDPITICQPPDVAFEDPIVPLCGPGPRPFTVCPAYDENCESGSVTYQWSVPAGVTFGSGSTAATPCPELVFPDLGDYELTITISNVCDEATASQTIRIVEPIANNILDPGNLITQPEFCDCINGVFVIEGSEPTGGNPSYIYQWQKSTDGGTNWTNVQPGGTGQNLTLPTPYCQTAHYRRWVYDQGDCESVSAPILLLRVPPIENNQISASQNKCAGQVPALLQGTSASGGDGTILYQWESQTGTSTWEAIDGATSQSYQPPAVTETTSYRRVATSGPCDDISSSVVITLCDPIDNNSVKVTVDNIDYTTYEICAGNPPPVILGSTPTGACNDFSYQWQKAVNDPDFNIFTDINGATAINYQAPTLTATTHYRRIVKPNPETGCDDHVSNEMIIIVHPNPIASGAAFPSSISAGETTELQGNATSGTPPYTFCWTPAAYISGDNCQQNVTTTKLYESRTFTLSVTDAEGCSGSKTVPVTVGAGVQCGDPTATPNPVCPGCPSPPGNVSLSVTASGGTGTYSYSWVQNPPGTLILGQTISLCPVQTSTFTVTVTDGLTSCNKSIEVVVDPLPVISDEELTICSNAPLNYTPVSNLPGTTFTWTSTSSGCSGNAPSGTGTINNTLVNNGLTPCTVVYTITPIGPGSTMCPGAPATFTVTVLPVANVTNSSSSQVVVDGQSSLPVSFTSNVEGAGFDWVIDEMIPAGSISGAIPTGSGELPSMTLTITSGGNTANVKYKVTPYLLKPNSEKCPGNPFYYTILVNAEPTQYQIQCPNPSVFCEGTSAVLTLTNSETGVNYQLLNNSIPVPGSTLPGETGTPLNWNISETGSYTVRAISGNGQSVMMLGVCQVQVNPVPVGNYLISSTGNCAGDLILLNGSQIGVNYELYRDGGTTTQIRPGTGTVLSFDETSLPGEYTIKAVYPITQCFVWIDGQITLHPNPEPFVLNPSGDLCLGMELELDSSQAGILYQLWCIPDGATDPVAVGPPIPGTNNPIPFGAQYTPGIYYVQGYNPLTTCDLEFPDRRTYRPDPVLYNITPQPSASPNCGPTVIGLSNSQPGFRYYLHKLDDNGIPYNWPYYLIPVIGTGSAIQFAPPLGEPGSYVVIAEYSDRLCPKQMNGTVVIEQGLVPYNMNPTGNPVCIDATTGVEITLLNSEAGVEYTLSNDTYSYTNTILSLNGGPLSFGFVTQQGVYTVTAFNPANECRATMNGSATLVWNPTTFSIRPNAPNTICPGAQDIWLNGSEVGVRYTLFMPDNTQESKTGTGEVLNWGKKSVPGIYYIHAYSIAHPQCNTRMAGTVVIVPNPGVYEVVSQGLNCEPDTIGMQNSEAGVTYEIVDALLNPLPTPVTYLSPGGPFTFPGPPAPPATFPAGIYKVIARSAQECTAVMAGEVRIDRRPTVNAGSDAIICNIPPYSVQLHGQAEQYSSVLWSSPTAGAANFDPGPDALEPFYTFTEADINNKSVTLTITAFAILNEGCHGTFVTDQVTIELLAPVVEAGDNISICANEPVQLEGSVTGGTTTGTWTGGQGTFDPDRNSLHAMYTPHSDETGSTIILTLTSTGADPCPDVSDEVSITIFDDLVPGTAGNDQTICTGQSPQTINATAPLSGGSGTFAYQWQTWSGINWVSAGSGATSLVFNPGTLTASAQYRLRQTDTWCSPDQHVFTNPVIITVNPLGQVNPIANQTVCHLGSTQPVFFSTLNPGGTTTYQWSNSNTTIGLAVSGTGDIPAFQATNPGPAPVTATITVTPIYSFAGKDCPGEPKTFTITVNPAGQVNQPEDITECGGTIIPEINFTTGNAGGSTTYQWTCSNTTIGLPASGTGNLPEFTANNPGTAPVSATITVTPTYTGSGLDCQGPPIMFTITILPAGQVNQPADALYCNGDLTSLIEFTTVNGNGNTTFNWTNSHPSIGLSASGSGDIGPFTATNSGMLPIVATITVTPEFGTGNETCEGEPVSFTITVNPPGQVHQPSSQTVCHNALTAPVTFTTANTGGTTTYTWVNDNISVGLPPAGIGDIPGFAAQNPGLTPVTATITVTPYFTLGPLTCPGPSKSFTITVNPGGQVVQPSNLSVCHNNWIKPPDFVTQNTGGTVTYSWTNANTAIGLAAVGTGNLPGFTAINGGLSPVTALITVTPTFTSGGISCPGEAKNFTITVNPEAQVNQPPDISECNGMTITAPSFTTLNTGGNTTYLWSNGNTGIGLGASGTGNLPAFTAINTGNAPETALIEVYAVFENSGTTCDGPTETFTITVNPSGQVNPQPDIVECEGTTTSPIVFTTNNTGGIYNYQWTNSNTLIGLAASGSNTISPFTVQNGFTYPISATISVTPQFTNGGDPCDGIPMSFDITVNPKGQVNQPENITLCDGVQNVLLPPWNTLNTGGITTYAWSNSDAAIGLPAFGTGNLPAFNAVNTGNTPVTATITVIPTFTNAGTSCPGEPVTFQITVNPRGQVNPVDNFVKCNTDLMEEVVFSTSNVNGTTTYSWANSNPSIGLPSSGPGNLPSFGAINNGYGPETATITVTPTFASGGTSCPGDSKTFTITVNPSGHVIQPDNLTFCHEQNTTLISFSSLNTGGGNTTYTWTNSEPLIGLPASGTGNIIPFIALNGGTAPLTATITVTPVYTNLGVPCSGTPKTFSITVNPKGQVDQPINITKCNNETITPAPFTTINTGGTTTYQWSNSNTSIGLGASGTGHLPSFTAINTGNLPVTATIVVYAFFENAGTTCDGPSKTFTITVNPDGQVNPQPDIVECEGTTTLPIVFTTNNTGGIYNYQWTNSNTLIGLASSGTNTISPFTVQNGFTYPISATISVTPQFTNGGDPCDGTPMSFNITVNPKGQVNQPENITLCDGDQNVLLPPWSTLNTGGNTTYAWSNSDAAIGLPAFGTGNLPAFNAVNTGNTPVTATITVIPTFTNAGTSCPGEPVTFQITVNPRGQVNPVANFVKCNTDVMEEVVFSTSNVNGTTTYSWTNSNLSIGLPSSGPGNLPSFVAVNTGYGPETATITVTPTFTSGGKSCQGDSKTFTITVNPSGHVIQPDNLTFCHQQNTTLITFSSLNTGEGNTTYTWTNSEPLIGLPASGTGDIIPFIALNGSTAPLTATITVTPVYTNLGVSCSGTPKTFTITVNPKGQVNQPLNITECNGATIAPDPFTTVNTGGTTTYQWSNSNTSIGLGTSGTGHLPSFTAINMGNSPVTATIEVYAFFENAGTTCDGPTETFTITVNPGGKVDKPADMVLCHEEWSNPVVFTSANSGGTTTYSWTNSHPEIGIPVSGNGNIASFQAQNSGTSPIVATIVITPTFTQNSVSCEGQPVSFTITVNPKGQVNQPENYFVCHEGNIPLIVFGTGNTGGTTTYAWSNNMPVIGLPSTGTGNIDPFQALNPGYAPITANITVTPTFTANGKQCEGDPVTFSITVNPTAIVNKPPDIFLCHGQPSGTIDFTTLNSGGTMTYYWENDLPAIGLPAADWGAIPSFNAINQNFFPRVATITVKPYFTNGSVTCEGVPVTFTITVNPAGEVNQPPDITVCNQDVTAPVLFSTPINGGEVTYYWTNDNPSIGLAADGNGDVPSFTATNNEPNPVTANITVTPTFTLGGTPCPGPMKTFTITINPNGQVNQPGDLTVCEEDVVIALPFTTVNTGGTTTYQWSNSNTTIGLQASGTGNLPEFNAINNGLSPVTATIEVTALFENGGTTCPPLETRSFTITVNPRGEVNQPPDIIVCNDEATSEVVFTTPLTGGVVYYEWSNSNTSIGLGASGNGNVPSFVAVNPGQDPVSAIITVIPLFENDGTTCDGPSKSFTVNVYGNLAPGTVSQDQIICYGATPSLLTATPPVGGTLPPVRNYQWQVKTTPPDIWNDIPGATNLNYQPPALTRNTMFRLQVTDPACLTPQTVHSNTVTIAIDIPTANFTASTACLGDATIFTNNSSSISGPNLNYSWAFGDGGTSNLKDPLHLYLNQGIYNVTLTVTSAKGCINDTVKQVLVRPLPFAVFTAGDPRCAGDSIVFTDHSTTSSGAICRAEWDFGDGNTKVHRYPQQSQVVKHRYLNGDTYAVTLTVITTDSCRKSVTMPVAVYHAPVAGFYTSDILCKQKEVQFHDMTQSAGGLQIVSWHWNFGDPLSGVNDTSTYRNPLHAFTGTGNYTVVLTATNMYGCKDTASMTLTIHDKPLANFKADTACLGASTSFTSLSTPASAISTQVWDFGNGQVITANNPTYTFPAPGIHMVKLTVINGFDCEDDTIKPVLVLPKPAAGYTYQTPACAGDSIQFTDVSFTSHGNITKWTWNFGDGTAPVLITDPALKNVKHLFENGGTYQVKLIIETSDDCIDSTTTAVTIGEKPLANFSFTPLSPCAETGVSFTDMTQLNGGTALNTWSWNFGDPGSGINNSNSNQNPTHIYNNPGTYTIRLTVTNATGCSDSVETGKQITVKPLPEASFDVEASCIGSQTLFTSTSTSPNGTIQLCSWNFGDPASGINNTATGNPVTHAYNYQGVYNVTLMVSDEGSCTRDTVQQVTINTRPTADFLVQNVPCEADSTDFRDQSLPNGSLISGWDWDFGDETPHSFIQNPKHKYEDPGTFNVKLVVTNVLGCKDSITIPVTVHHKPEALFSYQSLYWPAGKVDFIDQSNPVVGSIASRQWTFMPNVTGTGQPATYTYPVTGVKYLVTLTVENTMGCRDTIRDSIYVNKGYDLGIYSETACLGKPARFHPTNPSRQDGDTLIYIRWDFGDVFNPATNNSSLWNASHVYTHPGTYPVTLTATNSNGHQETVFKTIVPYHPPTATFTFDGGPHCNASEPVIFRYPLDSLGPDPNTIHWHFGHGSWEYELPPFTGEKSHVFPSNGLFNVSMVVVNGNGCRDTLVKPVNLVCISASFDTLIKVYCDSIPIKFTDLSAPSGNIGSWLWNFGDPSSGAQNTSSLQHPTHTYVLPADESRIYTVKLVVTSNPAGFKDSVSTRITIHPSTTFRVDEKLACLNDSVRFTTSPADTTYLYIQEWEWKFNDQWSSQQGSTTQWNPAHRYKRPGTYYPTLSVTNSYGCVYTDTGKVVIGIPPVAKMVVPDPFCTRQWMTLYDESVPSGAVINYWNWNFNNESSSLSRYPTHRFNEPGQKRITLMVRDQNNCTDTVDSLIMVYPTPVGKFIVIQSPDDPQGMIRIENLTEPLENTLFLWDFGDGKTSALPDPVYSYSSDGNYTIKMVATVGNGCSDTTFYSLKMLFKGLFVPNAFKPNTMSDYLFKPAGINLKYYNIRVFDPFGRLMWESNKLDTKGQPVEGWDGTYMGQPMPQGNYVWTINAVFADDKAWEGMYNESTGQKHTKGTIVLLR